MCTHEADALVHRVGDTATLAAHLTMLHENRALLAQFRQASLKNAKAVTWSAAGIRLLQVYRNILAERPAAAAEAGRG
jgi:hypothetical protein